jgi:hypothetical protein
MYGIRFGFLFDRRNDKLFQTLVTASMVAIFVFLLIKLEFVDVWFLNINLKSELIQAIFLKKKNSNISNNI